MGELDISAYSASRSNVMPMPILFSDDPVYFREVSRFASAGSEILFPAELQAYDIGQKSYTVPLWSLESKKPNLKGWARCLIILVPTAGFELAT